MDKSFADIFNEVKTEMGANPTPTDVTNDEDSSLEETPVADATETPDTNISDVDNAEETNETKTVEEDVTNVSEEVISEQKPTSLKEDRTFKEFAEMRTKNKDMEAKIARFEAVAKQMGVENADKLLEQSEESLLVKEAEKKGMSVDDYKTFKNLENRINSLEADKTEAEKQRKINTFDTISTKIQTEAKLSENDVKLMANNITKDFTYDELVEMPD
jgi:hypothetical protein